MNRRFSALKKPKFQLLLLLALLVLVALVGGGDRQGKAAVLAVSLATAILAEWAFFGAVPGASLQSAAISGSIVGMLLSPGGNLIVVWSAAVVAIASKKLLVFRERKHIFNPAGFGLMVTVLIFGNQVNWWGNSSVVLLVLGAGLLMLRLRRFSLPFAYFLTRTASATVMGGAANLAQAFLLPNLFFAFVMLVEPKTSPTKRTEQWLFGGLCGLLATLYYHFLPAYEGDIMALLTLNLIRPAIAFQSWAGQHKPELQQTQNGGRMS